jgi:hypothetical protein
VEEGYYEQLLGPALAARGFETRYLRKGQPPAGTAPGTAAAAPAAGDRPVPPDGLLSCWLATRWELASAVPTYLDEAARQVGSYLIVTPVRARRNNRAQLPGPISYGLYCFDAPSLGCQLDITQPLGSFCGGGRGGGRGPHGRAGAAGPLAATDRRGRADGPPPPHRRGGR